MEKLFKNLEKAKEYFTDCQMAIVYAMTNICLDDILINETLKSGNEDFKSVFDTLSNTIIEQLAETNVILGLIESIIETYKGVDITTDDPVFNAAITVLNSEIREYDEKLTEFKNIVTINTDLIVLYLHKSSGVVC